MGQKKWTKELFDFGPRKVHLFCAQDEPKEERKENYATFQRKKKNPFA